MCQGKNHVKHHLNPVFFSTFKWAQQISWVSRTCRSASIVLLRSAEISLTLKRAEAMPWGTPGFRMPGATPNSWMAQRLW